MAAGAAPILFFTSLLRASGVYAGSFWARPSILSLGTFWEFLLLPIVAPAILLLAIIAARAGRGREPSPPGLFAYEIAAAIGFLIVPVTLLAIAFAATNAYSDRYALPAAAGVAILGALAADRFRVGGTVFAVLFALFTLRQLIWAMFLFTAPPNPLDAHPLLKETRDRTVVIANGVLYLQLAHYAPNRRFVYVADPALARKYTNADSVDRALAPLRQWKPLRVISFPVLRNSTFLLYQSPPEADGGRLQWIARALSDERATISLRGESRGSMLFDVTMTGAAGRP
jgi:hypothetical protein